MCNVSMSNKVMQEQDTVVKKVEYAACDVWEYYLLRWS